MALRVLFRTKAEAEAAAKNSGKSYYKSTCDCNGLDTAEGAPADAFGITNCYRTDTGDIFAWWELED